VTHLIDSQTLADRVDGMTETEAENWLNEYDEQAEHDAAKADLDVRVVAPSETVDGVTAGDVIESMGGDPSAADSVVIVRGPGRRFIEYRDSGGSALSESVAQSRADDLEDQIGESIARRRLIEAAGEAAR
jgi:hypothetical protein